MTKENIKRVGSRYQENDFRHSIVQKGNARVKSLILKLASTLPKSNIRILDLGAGDATFSIEFAQKVNATKLDVVDGVDMEEVWAKKAESVSMDFNGLVTNFEEPLPYPNESFDVVISINVIEHVYDPFLFLQEIHRVLRNDGYAIICAPNLSGLQYRLELLFGFLPTTMSVGLYNYNSVNAQLEPHVAPFGRHISCFTLKEFKKVINMTGFNAVEIKTGVIYFLPTFIETLVTKIFPLGNYMFFKLHPL